MMCRNSLFYIIIFSLVIIVIFLLLKNRVVFFNFEKRNLKKVNKNESYISTTKYSKRFSDSKMNSKFSGIINSNGLIVNNFPACSGHGKLVSASDRFGNLIKICSCNPGWGGPNCSQTCNSDCGSSEHKGRCVGGLGHRPRCVCKSGWSGSDCSISTTLPFGEKINNNPNKLNGVVDLHTHLMAHLGFGGHLIHGAPDAGCLMLPDQIYKSNNDLFGTAGCNNMNQSASDISQALGDCRPIHQIWLLNNECGNDIRALTHSALPGKNDHGVGYPDFQNWPKYNNLTHQQMWVDWLYRAYQGGLRCIVALAVNSVLLAELLQKDPNKSDDQSNGDLQIEEIKNFAQRHQEWIEVAYSSGDLRRIVGQNDKLAIIIGIEYDDIGNFMKDGNKDPDPHDVYNEIQRLYNSGVRYIFPVHLTDNLIGGTALNDSLFTLASLVQFGSLPDITCSNPKDKIDTNESLFGFENFINNFGDTLGKIFSGDWGNIPNVQCPQGTGYVNKRGLQSLGIYALLKMTGLKMLIDVDHMSQKTRKDVLKAFGWYTFMSGHNAIRDLVDQKTERNFSLEEYQTLANRGGMMGIGFSGNFNVFLGTAQELTANNIPIGFGSDCNGLAPLSPPSNDSNVIYSAQFPKCKTGNREWDYNVDGVAHIGLYPDFLRDVKNHDKNNTIIPNMFGGVEALARVWEKNGG